MSDTFEQIQQRILDRIPANIDKTEGEVTQTTVGPLSVELEQVYGSIDRALDEIFPDTQTRPFLVRDAETRRGLAPFPATFCVAGAMLTGDFPEGSSLIGTRYFSNDIPFIVTRQLTPEEIAALEEDKKYNYEVTSEVAGQRGNRNSGALVPFENVPGLRTAVLVDIVSPGRDEETTEEFRTRYIDYLRGEAWGGNKLDYYWRISEKTDPGVVKVFRAEDRGGYFDILVLMNDDDYSLPSAAWLAELQAFVDPSDDPGGGSGIAGIGQKPIIMSPEDVTINVNIGFVEFTSGTWATHVDEITVAINEYLLEMRKRFFETREQTVFVSQILTRITNLGFIRDINSVTVNGSTNNVLLSEKQVPYLGTVTNS